MSKKSGAAAADALAKVLGVYLSTSAREKDKNIDQQRWQAQFELQKQQHQVAMQQAAREQAAYEKAQAEDKDVAGWMAALKGQGITPPPEVDTQHELKNWMALQNEVDSAAMRKKKAQQEDEMYPAHKKLLEAQADYYSNRGTQTKPPKNMRERLPEFLRGQYDQLDGQMRFLNTQIEGKRKDITGMDDMDTEAPAKKAVIQAEIKQLEDAQISLFQHKKEMEDAVVQGGVQTPEQWDAYTRKLKADAEAVKTQGTDAKPPADTPQGEVPKTHSKSWWERARPKGEDGQPKPLAEMTGTETGLMLPKVAGVAAMDAADAVVRSVGPHIPNVLGNFFAPFNGPPPANYAIPGAGQVFVGDSINQQKLQDYFGLNNIAPRRGPDSADSQYAPRSGTPFGRR